jgi:hypothetical protein
VNSELTPCICPYNSREYECEDAVKVEEKKYCPLRLLDLVL